MKIQGLKKIIKLSKDELNEYDLCGYGGKESKINADVFIYSYSGGGWDGSGMAVWRKDDKWSYHELSHCSCYGPTENIEKSDGVKITLKQLISLLKKNYSDEYHEDAIKVREYLEKYYQN